MNQFGMTPEELEKTLNDDAATKAPLWSAGKDDAGAVGRAITDRFSDMMLSEEERLIASMGELNAKYKAVCEERDRFAAELVARDAMARDAHESRMLTRERATMIAQEAAKMRPPSYYSEPFIPHEWVVDAIQAASIYGPTARVDALEARLDEVERKTGTLI